MNLQLCSRLFLAVGLTLFATGPIAASIDPLTLNLHDATVVLHAKSDRAKLAAQMLIEEVEKRTGIRWKLVLGEPAKALGSVIDLSVRSDNRSWAPEGFAIEWTGKDTGNGSITGARISIVGNDERGLMYGCGRLMRNMSMSRGSAHAYANFPEYCVPALPLRGHQLGYRPKTNSYDAWTPEMWEQYIRDLIMFGANAIELIPPRSDDAPTSPHFVMPQIEMMKVMSGLADKYGVDVWIWYPAMDKDYSDPATVEFALKEWGDVFRQLPRVDAVFVPGGDPGHTQPKYLMALLEKETEVLHQSHPNAQMWMSPQSFNQEWMDEFAGILKNEQPAWLSGLVFGPQNRPSLEDLRAMTPPQYKIRLYPDITHSIRSQYPVDDWDTAYAITEDREVINPRPLAEANILRVTKDNSIGFITYSEGCNDDVNKMVWSAVGWDPSVNVKDVLQQYSRYFIGGAIADDFADGLLALEQNWRVPLLSNDGVEATLRKFQAMEQAATPDQLTNWRFQQALFRAYYDAYTRRRLIFETDLQKSAMDILANAKKKLGANDAIDQAKAVLARATSEPIAPELRTSIFALAEALFRSIRMQLSVPLYKAIDVGRGAHLDLIDRPLNDRQWLEDRFAEIRDLKSEKERLKAIDAIVHWTDPAPGGFYDDLGNPVAQPHLMRGEGSATDPEYRNSSRVGFAVRKGYRMSWNNFAESVYDAPLKMYYDGLEPNTEYRLRVVYAGERDDRMEQRIRLQTDDGALVHDYMDKPMPPQPIEFAIPKSSTQDGLLTLIWNQTPGQGHAGRSCQIAEVWLEPLK